MTEQLDLAGIGLKLSRANSHMDRLRSILVGEHDIKLSSEYNAGQEGYNLYYQVSLDLSLGILVGDLVHNARSALDHLVAALVTRGGGEIQRQHAFPIYATEGGFLNDVWQRSRKRGPDCLVGLPIADREAIRDLQPYIGRNREQAERTPLYRLHACWNLDKHRLVQAGSPYAAEGDYEFGVEPPNLFIRRLQLFFGPGTVLPPGVKVAFAQIGVLPGTERPPRADFKMNMTLSVAFGEPGKLPFASVGNFPEMIEEVVKIVRVFDPGFVVPVWVEPSV